MSKALSPTQIGIKTIEAVERRVIRRVTKTVERAADDHFWLDDDGVPIDHPDNPFLAEKVDKRRLNAAQAMLKSKRDSRVGLEIGVRLLEAERKAQALHAGNAPAALNVAVMLVPTGVAPPQYEVIDVTPGRKVSE